MSVLTNVLGSWGTNIVFRVNDQRLLTFKDMTRTVGSEWAAHNRIGRKSQSEYLHPALQKVTFTMELDAINGIRPREILDDLAKCCENGIVNTLMIGGKRVGDNRWVITELSEAWETIYNHGELVRAKVNVNMTEYVE